MMMKKKKKMAILNDDNNNNNKTNALAFEREKERKRGEREKKTDELPSY